MSRSGTVPIPPIDTAGFELGAGVQPYLITVAALLAPGGFVDGAGEPDLPRLRSALAASIAAEPVLCRRAERRSGTWWWIDAEPDLAVHLICEEIRSGETGLEDVCARLVMADLDPDRPLWQVCVIPRARAGQCGLVIRIHHVVADGAHAVELIERVFTGGLQTPRSMTAGSVTSSSRRPHARSIPWSERLRYRVGTVWHPWIRSGSLLGPLGTVRHVAGVGVDLRALERGARAAGGTLNDAYLVACGAGLRHALTVARADPPRSLAVSVPVGLPAVGSAGNAVSFMLVDLPLRERDPVAALRLVAGQTASTKAAARAAGPTFRSTSFAHWFDRLAEHQHIIAAVASNVPGPRERLVIDGAPVVELWPLGPLAGNVRVGFTATSYADRLWIGVETATDRLAPAAEIARVMAATLGDLARPPSGEVGSPGRGRPLGT